VTFDPESFFTAVKRKALAKIQTQTKVKLILRANMEKTDLMTGESLVETHQLRSKNKIVLESTDKNELLSLLAEQVLEDLAKFQMNGSGWSFHSIVALDIHTVGYKPLRRGAFVKLRKFLSRKEALVNMKFRNEMTTKEDNQCFKWCIARALNPVERDSGRISKILRKQAESLNFTGITFLVSLKAIDK